MTPYKCVLCGESEEAPFMEPTRSRMIANQHCFGCDFYMRLAVYEHNPNSFIDVTDNRHYQVGPEDDRPKSHKGFGGAAWKISFEDGRVVHTTNLWHQGPIPEHMLPFFTKTPKAVLHQS